MLILQYRSIRQLVFPFLLIMSLALLGTITSCGKKSSPPTSPSSSNEECNSDVCGPIESTPIADQPLAIARYSILMKIQRQTGKSPLPDKTLFSRDDVLFPRGQSGKVYILTRGHESTKDGYPIARLACYKSNGKSVMLLYSMKLKLVRKPPQDDICVRNMLDYLSLIGDSVVAYPYGPYSYTIPGNISRNAKRDLSLKQELVDYSYEPVISVMHVHHFHPDVNESLWFKYEHMQSFDVQGDNPAEESQWYKKYGFPVADCELSAKGDKKKVIPGMNK